MAMKHSSRDEQRAFLDMFGVAWRIVGDGVWRWDDATGRHVQSYTGRPWFKREIGKYQIHPAVWDMMEVYRPDDWQRLLLEWPHRSETDANRIAYTPNERYGIDDRQLVTTIGKYLTRHFSDVGDHVIRDMVARHTFEGHIVLTDDPYEMVRAVIDGPHSCMSHEFNIRCDDGERRHPYAVYNPRYGWRMAIRYDGPDIMGRCLVLEDGEEKLFVRSYKRADHGSHGGVDEAIEAWLKAKGCVKDSNWPDGARLARYETSDGGFLMPYIDGDYRDVDDDRTHMSIRRRGELVANNTSGIIEVNDSQCSCCGGSFHSEDDNAIWVGYHAEEHVGPCCSDEYRHVTGRNGRSYYVHSDNAAYCETDGEYYDNDYLCDNDIVEDVHGDYRKIDDVIEVDGDYYPTDDDSICYADDVGEHRHKDDCWQCFASDRWYTDDFDYVEVDGEKYHPDEVPETETTDEENNNAA